MRRGRRWARDLPRRMTNWSNWWKAGRPPFRAGKLSTYLTKAGTEKDLASAADKLKAAIVGDLRPGEKSTIEAQLGSTQLQVSIAQYLSLQKEIGDLTEQAIALQDAAQAAIDVGSDATTLEKGAASATAGVAQLKDAADKAAAEVTARQAALTQAQGKIKAIQDQISAKDVQARKIYANTDAAFQASDALKGAAAIAGGKKAMDDRRAADQLMADIGNLAPDLLQAQGDVALAQVSLNDAQNLAKGAVQAHDSAMAAEEKTVQRAKDLRAAATKMVNDPNGVKQKVAAFTDAYSKLDKKIKEATTAADQAAASFGSASTDFRSAVDDAKKVVDDRQLDASDPLSKFAHDSRMTAILLWSQSAAAQQGGRVQLAGADAADMVAATLTLAGMAYAAAQATDAPKPPANSYLGDAGTHFTRAADTAANGNRLPAPAQSDLDRIKWIGYGLEASAQLGVYRATGNNAAALTAAKTAQANAVRGNPALESQMSWVNDVK